MVLSVFTILSHICSILNVATWTGVAIPQMFMNYKNQSVDAISFLLLYCWLFGGALSLFSAIVANAAKTIIYIGVPHLILDICMLSQLIYYRIKNKRSFSDKHLIFIICSLIFVISIMSFFNKEILINGFSWSATGIFIIAKVPQILLNKKRRSCSGLSIISFIFVMCTNLLFLTSVLLLIGNYPDEISKDQPINKSKFVINNLAWLCSSSISFILDIVILFQFWIYNRRENSLSTTPLLPDLPSLPTFNGKRRNRVFGQQYSEIEEEE
jgi:uncharacterized protein with PQ loop repeat